jgi:hypothetical protein
MPEGTAIGFVKKVLSRYSRHTTFFLLYSGAKHGQAVVSEAAQRVWIKHCYIMVVWRLSMAGLPQASTATNQGFPRFPGTWMSRPALECKYSHPQTLNGIQNRNSPKLRFDPRPGPWLPLACVALYQPPSQSSSCDTPALSLFCDERR